MAKADPLITVFMPVYNGQRFLREAVESVLNQSFTDFEFLIIDDGSTDGSPEIIRSYSDPRIRRVTSDSNLKLPATRNRGLELASGRYLANMDCDDVSRSDRLLTQFRFMESHPEVGACGSWVRMICYRGNAIKRRETIKYPMSPAQIKSGLLFDQPLANPSAMMRLTAVRSAGLIYEPEHLAGLEDWGFWQKASFCFDLANIPQVLLDYRFFEGNLSNRSGDQRKEIIKLINRRNLEKLGVGFSPHETMMHCVNAVTGDRVQLSDYHQWLESLARANRIKNIYPREEFDRTVAEQWWSACLQNTRLGPAAWMIFWQGPLSRKAAPGTLQLAKFAVKCMLMFGRE